MVATAIGMQVRGWKPFAVHLRGVPEPRLRLRPNGRGQPREHRTGGVARRRQHRRGRAEPDGARGPRQPARGARLDGALPVGPEPDGRAGAPDGGPRRHRLHAHDTREDADPVRARRGVPYRWIPGRARDGDADVCHPHRRRDHAARGAERRRSAGGGGDRSAGGRPLQRQADRCRDGARGGP